MNCCCGDLIASLSQQYALEHAMSDTQDNVGQDLIDFISFVHCCGCWFWHHTSMPVESFLLEKCLEELFHLFGFWRLVHSFYIHLSCCCCGLLLLLCWFFLMFIQGELLASIESFLFLSYCTCICNWLLRLQFCCTAYSVQNMFQNHYFVNDGRLHNERYGTTFEYSKIFFFLFFLRIQVHSY